MESDRRSLPRRGAALLGALLLPLAALLISGSSLDAGTACAGTWWIEPAELEANAPLPEFGFSTCEGETKTTADYQGQPLLINFWATWCPPCVRELPGLRDLHEELGDEVALLGVSVDDSPAQVRGFLEDHPLPYTLAWDSDGIATDLGISSIPLTLAVDADGKLAGIHRGYADADDLKTLVAKARRASNVGPQIRGLEVSASE